MAAKESPIPHHNPGWTPGFELIAEISKNVIEHVRIIRDHDGQFFQKMLIALTPELVEAPHYYCKILRTGEKQWFPPENLSLPRGRPYYGPKKRTPKEMNNNKPTSRRRKLKKDYPVPLTVLLPSCSSQPDPNTTYFNNTMPKVDSKANNAYKDFIRRGKEKIMRNFYSICAENRAKDGTKISEDKVKILMINEKPKEKEMESYLAQCWRYNHTFKVKMTTTSYDSEASCDSDGEEGHSQQKPVMVHISWCIVCGLQNESLCKCTTCPASFHSKCCGNWITRVRYRKNLTQQLKQVDEAMKSGKIVKVDSTTTCPHCAAGPPLSYGDMVWSKLGSWSWWPARILEPGSLPSCLVTGAHQPQDWPLAYYGAEKNFAWSDKSRMCIFLPHHITGLNKPELQEAIDSASDDYIVNYLKHD